MNSGEQIDNQGGMNYDQWAALSEEPFAGDISEEPKDPEMTATMPENLKPVGELSEGEAAQEYLDLLVDLSSNFTSPEGKTSGMAVLKKNGEIEVRDPRGYDRSDRLARSLLAKTGTEFDNANDFYNSGNPYVERAHSMTLADNILRGEQRYRKAQAESVRTQQELQDFQQNVKLDSLSQKDLPWYKHTRHMLEESAARARQEASAESADSNQIIQDALMNAYSPDYYYGHHRLNAEHVNDTAYIDKVNEEYNQMFFGGNREEKVARALELREKLGVA